MSIKPEAAPRPRKVFVLLPLLIFLGLAAVFLVRLMSSEDISAIPSALIGEPAPETRLPPLEGIDLPGLELVGLRRQRYAGQRLGLVVRALPG